MNDFLPQGYAGVPKTNSKYLKFEEGQNKFRILSSAITGFIDWTEDKKPLRTKEQPQQLVNPSKPAKHFWAFVVFDYKAQEVKILEITQVTIQSAIYDLHCDTNWGSPLNYDITVKKTGKDMETKYSVIPTPPMPLKPEIKQLYEGLKIDLNALYDNGDPFGQVATENASNSVSEPTSGYVEETINPEDIPF